MFRLNVRTAAWLESYDGPIGPEIRDLQITVAGDVAFNHASIVCRRDVEKG